MRQNLLAFSPLTYWSLGQLYDIHWFLADSGRPEGHRVGGLWVEMSRERSVRREHAAKGADMGRVSDVARLPRDWNGSGGKLAHHHKLHIRIGHWSMLFER